ncbi:MAG: rRNA maturation RNase YbeY [Ruminococcaceae bacterium]|nr:rRNA maturation RNase YbeY [Oscillospiraceae bacterium]
MAKRHFLPVEAEVPGVSDGSRAFIRKVIRTALETEGVTLPCEIDVLVTNDRAIRKLNREQRKIDKATDVLSFPALELKPGEKPTEVDADPGTGLVPLGDMVLSWERVAAQAKEYGHSNRRELAYLVTHSVLHLLGYDHMDEGEQKALMRAHEEAVMDRLELKRQKDAQEG